MDSSPSLIQACMRTVQACFFFFSFFKFIYFWLHWVFVAARGLSLVAASGGYSLLQCVDFSLRWLLLLQSMGSRHTGFSSRGAWAQQLWRMGLVALRHVGSSRTRARTHVPCIDRRILNHCATREAPGLFLVQSGPRHPGSSKPSDQYHFGLYQGR